MLLFFLVPFWCLLFYILWCCTVLDLVISTYFNHVNGAKSLIHINLCTESDLFPFLFSCIWKKSSTRLQWYSCARYKAPGPLVWKFYFWTFATEKTLNDITLHSRQCTFTFPIFSFEFVFQSHAISNNRWFSVHFIGAYHIFARLWIQFT